MPTTVRSSHAAFSSCVCRLRFWLTRSKNRCALCRLILYRLPVSVSTEYKRFTQHVNQKTLKVTNFCFNLRNCHVSDGCLNPRRTWLNIQTILYHRNAIECRTSLKSHFLVTSL